jgi:2-amino-4-hydroxy-6-hydroxymethyldihydropteridine diphosphokinase
MGELVYVALGSNIADRATFLRQGLDGLRGLPRTRVIAETPVEETAPFGPAGQDPYLNQMVAIDTALAPHELLDALQRIEHDAGRTRDVRWGPRTLDLDIVRFGDRVITDSRLTVPHPGLAARDFWQRELHALEEQLGG